MKCPRGGAIDDHPSSRREGPGRRSYDYDRDDRPPPSRRYHNDRDEISDRPRRYSRDGAPPNRVRDGRHSNDRYNEFDYDRPRRDRDDRRDYYNERDRERTSKPTPSSDGKSKKWFTLKKDKKGKTAAEQPEFDTRHNMHPDNMPPPPPPPPPPASDASSNIDINPAETERTPIHYMFPTAEEAAEERQTKDAKIDIDQSTTGDGAPDIPYLDVEEEYPTRESTDRRRRRRDDEYDNERRRVSPRRDAVTIFMSTRRGAIKVRLGSIIVGAALGGFIGKVCSLRVAFVLHQALYLECNRFLSLLY